MENDPFRKNKENNKEFKKEECEFRISEVNSFLDNDKKAISIVLVHKQKDIGGIQIEDVNEPELVNEYIQLRVALVESEYRGSNAAVLLYEKAIEYA